MWTVKAGQITLTYMKFPYQHWNRIRTNNTIEPLNHEIKRYTKGIGAFLDGQSALILRMRNRNITSISQQRNAAISLTPCLPIT